MNDRTSNFILAAAPGAGRTPLLRQCGALVPVTLGGMWRARWPSLTIVGCVMLVVVLLNAFLAMTRGFTAMAGSTGSEQIVVMLGQGAESEAASVVSMEQLALLANAPGLQRAASAAVLSPELTMTVSRRARDGIGRVNGSLRGLRAEGLALRDGFRLVEGRMFTPGRYELIVGRELAGRVSGAAVGSRIRLSGHAWTVVGTYALASKVFETEYLADLLALQSAYGREGQVQTVRARLEGAAALAALQRFIGADSRLTLGAVSERQFYQEQMKNTTNIIGYLGWPLVGVLSVGVLAGMFNTMLIVLEGRRQSLSILRMLGFSAAAIRLNVLLETVLLSIAGALAGSALVFLAVQGRDATLVGSGLAAIPYQLGLDLVALGQSLGLAVALGLAGGLAAGASVVGTNRPKGAK